jgi:hypothetical protein
MKQLSIIVLLLSYAGTAHATTYYADWLGGSNANAGTSQGAAWKSFPGMQQGAGCGGATHMYTPAAGDKFIFKGGAGETWPVACFGWTLPGGGNSTNQNYIGACISNADFATQYPAKPLSANLSPCANTTSWPSSGWTRPLFDMLGSIATFTAAGAQIIYAANPSITYVTIDDIEIAHQGIGGLSSLNSANSGNQCAIGFGNTNIATPAVGTIVENVYVHGAVTSAYTGTRNGSGNYPGSGYCASGVLGAQYVLYSELNGDDSSNGGTTPTPSGSWAYFEGGVVASQVIAYNKIHGTINGCDQIPKSSSGYSCHDNEIYHVGNAGEVDPGALHGHIVFDNQTASDFPSQSVYNNYIHTSNTGLNVRLNSIANVYNNVITDNLNNVPLYIQCYLRFSTNAPCPITDVVNIYNNTMSPGTCLNSTGTMGVVNIVNNICIGGGGMGSVTSASGTKTPNTNMTTTIANTFGYVVANKYAPSSSYSVTVGTGTNLTSSCGTLVALCSDTSGAPWFGGSAKSRGTSWDMGAYQGAGGTTGPPTVTITSPSAGTVSGTQTLTATATPQGSATISSVQFFIDGFPFGAPDTSSPYTTSWNTATAANANHVIGATATDSNNQPGTAGTVTVTVNNSIPGCFISTDNGMTPLSFTAHQAFTAQSANFSPTVIIAPWTANQNTVFALSQNPMGAYTDGAVLLRANSSGVWDAWNDNVGNYAAVNSAPYSAATAYTFSFTINFTGANAGTYNISETSPSSIVIATNYKFRSTALIASLGYINSIAPNDTPDTQKVCNFLIAPASTLTFSPVSLNFGNVVVSSGTPTLTDTVTSSGGSTTFTSVAITGNSDFTINSNSCTGSQTSCTTVVKFAPTATGVETATLTYTDNATGSPQTVAITGTGIASPSSATPSPTSVNLGNVQLNLPGGAVSGPVIVTLMNGPVTFDSTPVTFDNPDFSVASNTCNGSVSVPSCQTTVRFIPSSLSNETATMTYHDNAPSGGSTQTVALQGNGVNFPTPGPAVQFVGTLPFSMTISNKTVTYSIPVTCTNCVSTSANSYTCTCR